MTNTVRVSENGAANLAAESPPAWVSYCSTYSYAVLYAALAFLAAGLIFVAAAAYFEARKAKAEAERVEAEARKAAAEAQIAEAEAAGARAGVDSLDSAPIIIPVNAVTTFVKSFAAVLGDAKAWVAMVIIGLLLLWMAGAAPGFCGKDIGFGDANQAVDPDGNGSAQGNSAGNNSAGNATDNGSGNALGNVSGNALGNVSGNTVANGSGNTAGNGSETSR
jgi:hypothetical protein